MKKEIVIQIQKLIIFVGTGILIFSALNYVFTPIWNYPTYLGNATDSITTFYQEEPNSLDVIFVGTSHGECAISPMQIYKDYGITSYNLCTMGQPIEATYYLLKESFKTQSPQVVCLDISNLYTEMGTGFWRYIMDTMPLSKNKLQMANGYSTSEARRTESEGGNAENSISNRALKFAEIMFPIIAFHERWKDFENIRGDIEINNNYTTSGYWMFTTKSIYEGDLNDFDKEVEELVGNEGGVTYIYSEYTEGVERIDVETNYYLESTISPYAEKWLVEINRLCEANNAEFRMIKVPSVYYPAQYGTVYTKSRAAEAYRVSQKYGIEFYDLQYQSDMEVDNYNDWSSDVGHMNYWGAKKVSDYIGAYLADECEVLPRKNARFDSNIPIYDNLTTVADLQLTEDIGDYVDLLVSNNDKWSYVVTSSKDISELLTTEMKSNLIKIGIGAEFLDYYNDEYAAFIYYGKNGKTEYESISNRYCSYDGNITVSSVCGLTGGASVNINGDVCTFNDLGINFVVVDNATGKIVDSSSICISDDLKLRHINPMVYFCNYWL